MDIKNKNMYMQKQAFSGEMLAELPIAMAYVPMQKWRDILRTDVALSKGTIFQELYMPFKGKGVM